jgi:AraC-like DNA-binding protein
VTTGSVGVFHAGDEHDSLYVPGSLYATATLTVERIEALAARIGVVLDRQALGGSAIRVGQVRVETLKYLEAMMRQVHAGQAPADSALASSLLDVMILHCAREPRSAGKPSPSSLLRVVARARAYIETTLDEPISIDSIAAAAGTSRRTLHRAFVHVLGQTPYAYVNTLRLHRIRRDLASDLEVRCTVALAANKWGIGELGRLAGQYRKLFGELPSQTAARHDHETR